MKIKAIISAILMTVMIISPLLSMKNKINIDIENQCNIENDGYISVMKTENGKIETVSDKEYLIGVLAAETGLNYADEALKAQVIASFTYAEYIKKGNTVEGKADISDDPDTNQGYWDITERKEKWGDNYEKMEQKAEEIVESVYGKALTYNGELIKSVYFSLSAGVTQSAKTVWGEDLAYLQSVTSVYDKLSPDYSKTIIMNSDDFKKYFENEDIKFNDNVEDWIGKTDATTDGYINSVTICNTEFKGTELREILNLNSAVFTLKYADNKFTITSYGKGHQVGMSQYGADYMAKQGSDYEEILKHYYKGVEIKEI